MGESLRKPFNGFRRHSYGFAVQPPHAVRVCRLAYPMAPARFVRRFYSYAALALEDEVGIECCQMLPTSSGVSSDIRQDFILSTLHYRVAATWG